MYSSFQDRSGVLVAVVACWSFAQSMSIPQMNTAQRGAVRVVSDRLDASKVSFSERS